MRRIAITFAIFAVCAGCSSTAQRETAAQTATNISLVQKKIEVFSAARTEADAARQRAANRALDNALETESRSGAQIQQWKAADDEKRMNLFDNVTGAATAAADRDAAARAEMAAADKLAESTKARITLRSDQLTKSAKALAQLAEKDNARDTLDFYRKFIGEVKQSLDDAHDAAAKSAKAGASAAAKVTKKE
jgi:hypothetical protein